MSNLIEQIEIFPKIETSLITLDPHTDFRGEFYDVWRSDSKTQSTEQINVSYSSKGVFRGLHLQAFYQQSKCLTVLNGAIIDILVNVDPKSRYYGTFNFIHLNKGQQLQVPKKMAHGFFALTNETIVMYQCDVQRVISDEVSINPLDVEIRHCIDNRLELCDFIYKICYDNELLSPLMSGKDYSALKLSSFNVNRLPQ